MRTRIYRAVDLAYCVAAPWNIICPASTHTQSCGVYQRYHMLEYSTKPWLRHRRSLPQLAHLVWHKDGESLISFLTGNLSMFHDTLTLRPCHASYRISLGIIHDRLLQHAPAFSSSCYIHQCKYSVMKQKTVMSGMIRFDKFNAGKCHSAAAIIASLWRLTQATYKACALVNFSCSVFLFRAWRSELPPTCSLLMKMLGTLRWLVISCRAS